MARSNPNGAGAQWTALTPQNLAYLELGATALSKGGPADAYCDFWDTVKGLWPHI